MDVVVCLDIGASASSFPGRVGKIVLPVEVSFSERTEDKMHGACFQCNLSLSVLHCGMFMFFSAFVVFIRKLCFWILLLQRMFAMFGM